MRNNETSLIKVAVVGPESTGKSTMANFLASQLGTVCVPEFARYYCQHLDNQYTLGDEVNMFYGQVALEESLAPLAQQVLVCDTTILTVKVWCDHLFDHTPKKVLEEIRRRHYDFYLLMDIDLPWEDDPLRDFPLEREHFLQIWKKELDELGALYQIVSGTGEVRLAKGLEQVKTQLKRL